MTAIGGFRPSRSALVTVTMCCGDGIAHIVNKSAASNVDVFSVESILQ